MSLILLAVFQHVHSSVGVDNRSKQERVMCVMVSVATPFCPEKFSTEINTIKTLKRTDGPMSPTVVLDCSTSCFRKYHSCIVWNQGMCQRQQLTSFFGLMTCVCLKHRMTQKEEDRFTPQMPSAAELDKVETRNPKFIQASHTG